jgi:hypothetical protein
METCKSPRTVLNAAYALATACLKEHTSKFSRKDFTGPQLFACLVLREHQKKSYRGLVALLKDSPEWCAERRMRVAAAGHCRRLMRRVLKAGPGKTCFGQRWQAETVNSMVKRNLGSACRSGKPWGRKKDMLLRAATHNLMIIANP